MYHDTIRITFHYFPHNDVGFDYIFLISKTEQIKTEFSSISYGELLSKFKDIGFDLKYIKFNDISDDNTTVYCSYNFQSNFNVFFPAYKKLIKNKSFNLVFEYGVIIDGIFRCNNMNFFSRVVFYDKANKFDGLYKEIVINDKTHFKISEFYQIVDKTGKIIHSEETDETKNFEQHFFENYDVLVATRKYKLNRLKIASLFGG